jgi:hypothetical protein
MPDMTILTTGATVLSQGYDLVKTLLGMKTDAAVTSKVIELGGIINEARANEIALIEKNQSLLKEKDALEAKIVCLKAWDSDKVRYVLHEPQPGVVAYALKKSMANGEPAHWLCPNCYQNLKKSLLISGFQAQIDVHYKCPNCPVDLIVPSRILPKLIDA